jgi:hypothetical protein
MHTHARTHTREQLHHMFPRRIPACLYIHVCVCVCVCVCVYLALPPPCGHSGHGTKSVTVRLRINPSASALARKSLIQRHFSGLLLLLLLIGVLDEEPFVSPHIWVSRKKKSQYSGVQFHILIRLGDYFFLPGCKKGESRVSICSP